MCQPHSSLASNFTKQINPYLLVLQFICLVFYSSTGRSIFKTSWVEWFVKNWSCNSLSSKLHHSSELYCSSLISYTSAGGAKWRGKDAGNDALDREELCKRQYLDGAVYYYILTIKPWLRPSGVFFHLCYDDTSFYSQIHSSRSRKLF